MQRWTKTLNRCPNAEKTKYRMQQKSERQLAANSSFKFIVAYWKQLSESWSKWCYLIEILNEKTKELGSTEIWISLKPLIIREMFESDPLEIKNYFYSPWSFDSTAQHASGFFHLNNSQKWSKMNSRVLPLAIFQLHSAADIKAQPIREICSPQRLAILSQTTGFAKNDGSLTTGCG